MGKKVKNVELLQSVSSKVVDAIMKMDKWGDKSIEGQGHSLTLG